MNFHRGDMVTCVLPGELGKPRPAIVVQADLFNATHASVTLCPVTSHLLEAPLFRVAIKAGGNSGLKIDSQAMADKLATVSLTRVRTVIGHIEPDDLSRIEVAMALWLGLPA